MSNDCEYMEQQIRMKLTGCMIRNAVISEDQESFGFEVVRKKKGGGRGEYDVFTVWVDCDAEGNGPGWLNMEDSP